MQSFDDKQICAILEYNINRPYMGEFRPCDLTDAYGRIKASRDWDKPLSCVDIKVGKINGDIICGALWYEMSYNPVRFGTTSPFYFNDRNSIYRFCEKSYKKNPGDKLSQILVDIRYHLIEYLNLNALPNGAWHDAINTRFGRVSIGLRSDGHSNSMYKRLAHLRETIKLIARQNVYDFKKKRGPYRAEIMRMVAERHPDGERIPILAPRVTQRQQLKNVSSYSSSEMNMEFDAQDRIDNMLDSAQITIDNQAYVSADTYAQALYDIENIKRDLVNDHQK